MTIPNLREIPYPGIPFYEYMDLALYHPEYGYYAKNKVKIGAEGDFVTSPHLCADFGELLAIQFVQMWEILGKPACFQLVEMGAGHGLLAADILKYLYQNYPDFFACVNYQIIEKATGLITQQKHFLTNLARDLGTKITWCDWDEIEANSVTGCFFSNELVDALPVHLIEVANHQLKEIYVYYQDGQFQEVAGELSTPKINDYFNLIGIDIWSYEDGYRTEVNLAALDWLELVAHRLNRGYLLTIDYGYPAERFYHPRRNQGTLQCYFHHAHHNDPYINFGEQDITAHVDFTALEKQGNLLGLNKAGFIQQGLFLMALGLGERIAQLSNNSAKEDITTILQRREALHQLMNPMGLGNFGVLLQLKGLTELESEQILQGLNIP